MESRRKVVHILTIFLALLLRYLSPSWAALLVFAAFFFNLFLFPYLLGSLQREGESRLDAGVVFFPLALLIVVILFAGRPAVVAGAWALLAVGDGFAALVGSAIGKWKLPWNSEKSWAGLLAFIVFGVPAVVFMMQWCHSPLSQEHLIGLAIVVTVIIALLESFPLPINDNLTVGLGGSILLYFASEAWFLIPDYLMSDVGPTLLATAFLVNFLGAAAAARLRWLSIGGALAAMVVGFMVFLFQPIGWAFFVGFFMLGTGAGLFRLVMQKSPIENGRDQAQVLAKGLPVALFALLAVGSGWQEFFQIALVGSIAAALADTLETEIGSLWAKKAFLLTNLEWVSPGTPGAVSLVGSLAGVSACVIIGVGAAAVEYIPWIGISPVIIGGFIATLVESWLSADTNRYEKLGPRGLNFLTTLLGGVGAGALFKVI